MYSVKKTGRNKIVTVEGGSPNRSASPRPAVSTVRRSDKSPDSSIDLST